MNDKQYREFVSVKDVYAAEVIQDDADAYVAGTPEYIAPAADISQEAEQESNPQYYDGKAMWTYNTEGTTTVTITFSGIPAITYAKMTGKHYDASTGRVIDTGTSEPPNMALSFRYQKGTSDWTYYQYLKGTFAGGTEEASTKTNTYDVKTYQATYTAVVTDHTWEINGVQKNIKRIIGDTTTISFATANSWFTAVQTPDTGGTPTALTFTSLPADDATGISVDEDVVITFSNPISSIVPTLMAEDGTIISVSVAYDTTRKIVTLSHTTALDSSSLHYVIINATDVYGQSINQTITFTTA